LKIHALMVGKPLLPVLETFPRADDQAEGFFFSADKGFSGNVARLNHGQRPELVEEEFQATNVLSGDIPFNQNFDRHDVFSLVDEF